MITKEFVIDQLCEGGIDAIMKLIHALEIKPLIEDVIRNFDFEKVAYIISDTTKKNMCPHKLRNIAIDMLVTVSKGYESGESQTLEKDGLIAEYTVPENEDEIGTVTLRYVAEISSAKDDDL